MSATVARATCSLCKVELEKRELPRHGDPGFCDRCLHANQLRPVESGEKQ